MAKDSGGWSLLRDKRTGKYTVRFTTPQGQRTHRSTGTRDRAEAQRKAAEIYAEIVSGRRRSRVVVGGSLEDLAAEWLVTHSSGRSEDTIREYERYVATLFLPYFGSLSHVTAASCADYMRRRLREVSVSTVKKELSALRQFTAWLHERGHLPEPVRIESPPRRAVGTPNETRKQVRVDLTREQIERIIENLPEWTINRTTRRRIPVRAFVTVMAETGLRKGTLYRLRAPEHYHRGARHLVITPDIDKARDGRPLPITDRARAALDSVCPDVGIIFGQVDVRGALRRASMNIGLPPHLAGRVSYHDFRHAFITHLASRGASLAGLQRLAGHKHVYTTARYIHAAQQAAEEALSLLGTDTVTDTGRG